MPINPLIISESDIVAGGKIYSDTAIARNTEIETAVNAVISAIDDTYTFGGVKTLSSPVLNTGVSGSAIDTDNTMAADSDTLIPSQKAVKAYVAASGGFIDRGDPVAADYDQTDLTDADADWHELDLATDVSVPTTVKAVLLVVSYYSGTSGATLSFRDSANSNEYNVSECPVLVASKIHSLDIVVPCTNGIIDIKSSNINLNEWTAIQIVVKGWWL